MKKLSARDTANHIMTSGMAGLLVFGDDAMRVTLWRQDVLKTLLGPGAEEELRLTRISGAELRADPATLIDTIKVVGFFPGPRAVLIEGATDGLAAIFASALSEWRDGDAHIIATAGRLTAKSALRKVFDRQSNAHIVPLYDDPPSRSEIAQMVQTAGLDHSRFEPATWNDLEALSRILPLGDFRQTLEKLSLYKTADPTPVSPKDLEVVAPLTRDAELDEILYATAEAKTDSIGPLLARLSNQGQQPVGVCIAALRHFQALHRAVSHPNGAAAGISAVRPPVFGPRSSAAIPHMAVMERALIRLAMIPRRR